VVLLQGNDTDCKRTSFINVWGSEQGMGALPILQPPPPIKGQKPSCQGCDHCCRHIAVPIDKPTCKEDYNNVIWYLLHENIVVFMDFEHDWYVQFFTKCKALQDDKKCGVYPGRPSVCKDYEVENCERHGEGPAEKLMFRSAEAYIAFLEKKGVDWRFKWQKKVQYP
jgi:Fe-S-cluster containining protein